MNVVFYGCFCRILRKLKFQSPWICQGSQPNWASWTHCQRLEALRGGQSRKRSREWDLGWILQLGFDQLHGCESSGGICLWSKWNSILCTRGCLGAWGGTRQWLYRSLSHNRSLWHAWKQFIRLVSRRHIHQHSRPSRQYRFCREFRKYVIWFICPRSRSDGLEQGLSRTVGTRRSRNRSSKWHGKKFPEMGPTCQRPRLHDHLFRQLWRSRLYRSTHGGC